MDGQAVVDVIEGEGTDLRAKRSRQGRLLHRYPALGELDRHRAISRTTPSWVDAMVVLVLSAQHCDGFDTVVANNCLPAGDVSFGVRPLTITTPAL